MSRSEKMVAAAMVVYLATVAFIVFSPTADVPSASVAEISAFLASLGAPAWLSGARVEFVTNVLLFVPLTFLGSLLKPRWTWVTWTLLGFAASSLIELTQLVLLPGRSATVVDVVSNTLGALLGALLAVLARAPVSQ